MMMKKTLSNQHLGLILTILSTALTTFGIVYYLRRKRKSPTRFIEVGSVSEIFIYPVKSCRGISLDSAMCSLRGLKWGPLRDRKWMMLNEKDRFVSARQEPKLALIVPSLSEDNQELILSTEGIEPIKIPANANVSQRLICTTIWNTDICGYECGKVTEGWLSNIFAYQGYKLVVHEDSLEGRKLADDPKWKPKSLYKDESLYSDLTQYLLVSESSLEDLNKRLEEPVTMKNFRPNIVIKGCKAFAEDNWTEIKIGGAHLYRTHLCGRCRMTLVNPETGVMAHAEPLKTLREYRMVDKSHPDSKAFGVQPVFGVNFNIVEVGNMRVGDKVYAVFE